jgi:hypothetical protein
MRIESFVFAPVLMAIFAGHVWADGGYYSSDYTKEINSTAQIAAIKHDGKTEIIDLVLGIRGNAKNFLWIFPTPTTPAVATGERGLFDELAKVTVPHIVSGCGTGCGSKSDGNGEVDTINSGQVGIYSFVILRADSSWAIKAYMDAEGYAGYGTDDLAMFDEYIAKSWNYFILAKISAEYQEDVYSRGYYYNDATRQPIRITFDSIQPVYPMKLTKSGWGGLKVIIYMVSEHKVSADGMDLEFAMNMDKKARWINEYYPVLDAFREANPYLTKLSLTVPPATRMDDIALLPAEDNAEYQEIRMSWNALSPLPPAAIALVPFILRWARRRKA